jgi:NifU-like protein involved in Fe-S cluster formation
MRFLLHASKKTKSIKSPAPVPVNSQNITRKAWGQQCSPNCGCVIRFESNMDSDGKIVSASYEAKTVLTSFNKNGRLEPQYTTNHHKPLLGKCGCDTLHHLATGVTQHLSGRRLDQIRNTLGGCSSPAVVHTVLKAQQLSTRDTHCFQVVEHALVGMVCGYLPSLHHVATSSKLRQHHDEDYFSLEEITTKPEPQILKTTTLTWEAYVDEMYHQYNVERSA